MIRFVAEPGSGTAIRMLNHGSNSGTGINRAYDGSRMMVPEHPEYFICKSLPDTFDVSEIEFDVHEFFQVYEEATSFRAGNVFFAQQLHMNSALGKLVVELLRSKLVENVLEFCLGIASHFDLNMGSFHIAAVRNENVLQPFAPLHLYPVRTKDQCGSSF